MSPSEELSSIRAQQYRNRQQEPDGDWELNSWLQGYFLIDGHYVPKWIFVALLIYVGFAGPSILGYVVLFLIAYFVYTRVYLQGVRTPAQLFARWKAASAAPPKGDEKDKKKSRKADKQ